MGAAIRLLPGVSLIAALSIGCSGTGESPLASLRHTPPGVAVAVGQPAPEIVGNDLDGQEFRLSDARGKVVMLDFTGYW